MGGRCTSERDRREEGISAGKVTLLVPNMPPTVPCHPPKRVSLVRQSDDGGDRLLLRTGRMVAGALGEFACEPDHHGTLGIRGETWAPRGEHAASKPLPPTYTAGCP